MHNSAQCYTTRQSMRGKQFEVFHYRDRKMKNVGVHHHDFYEVYFFLGGQADFRVQGQFYHLEPGDILMMNPNELHEARVNPEEKYERIVLWIDRSFLRELGGDGWDLTACFSQGVAGRANLLRPDKAHRAILQNILEKLADEFYGGKPGHELYSHGLLLQFLVEINRLARKVPAHLPHGGETDIIGQVLNYIDGHYQEPVTLQSLADQFYISRYHLSHEFSSRVGTSIYRYIIFRRLMQSREMMDEGMAPGAVYRSCGFRDYANFYRAFKGEYGISPGEYFKES